jgi:predicted SAM-dependent methyltransferase
MRQLHIGGQVRVEGWEVLDALPGPAVDHVGIAQDLSRFPDGTFTTLYASHVVEHFDYKDELLAVLKEWRRVLAPGGRLFISVPDLDVLCRIFSERQTLTADQRFMVMRMMFGGHTTPYDYHKTGLNQEFLVYFLEAAGFPHIERAPEFNMFRDTSSLRVGNLLISLNVIAYRDRPASAP